MIDLEDSFGNLETADHSTVVTASIVGGGTLEGTTNATVSGGIATFTNLSDQKAGAITLAFKSGSLTAATSGPVVVSPAAASQLVIHVAGSSTATAGQPLAIQPVIEEEDSFGNLEQGDDSTVVTATLNTGSGPLAGTTTATVSGGVATFTDLFDDKAETIRLAFKSGGLTQATSGPVVISPAAASQLVVRVGQSSTTTAGSPFNIQPVIMEEDQFGNLEQSDNSTIVTAVLLSREQARSKARPSSRLPAVSPRLPDSATTKPKPSRSNSRAAA